MPAELKELSATLTSIEKVLDLGALRTEMAGLEEQAAQPDLWSDQEKATQVTSRLSQVQADLRRIDDLRRRLDDAVVLYELAEDEDDAGTHDEVEGELVGLRKAIGELEVRTLLGGEYDNRDALVTVQAEAGGVDAADWAEMLLRMYLRWAERHGYPTEVYDTSYAEEAGIKSATFVVKAQYAYGTLAGRARHPPAGADLAVRQPGPPADQLRRRRGAPGGASRPTTSRSTTRTCGSTSTGPRARAARA